MTTKTARSGKLKITCHNNAYGRYCLPEWARPTLVASDSVTQVEGQDIKHVYNHDHGAENACETRGSCLHIHPEDPQIRVFVVGFSGFEM